MILKITFFLFLSIILYADDSFLYLYRNSGIQAVEAELNRELTSTQMWKKTLQNRDTHFGYFEGVNTFLVCDKNTSTLKLYIKDENATFKLNSTYQAFTGKFKGVKKVEGDLKTPTGVYTLKMKLDKVDPFYGPMAFVTSYPNIHDRYHNRKGHGIWIHGLPLDNEQRDSFTKGCIAIKNSDLVCLDTNLFLNSTLLYIDSYPHFSIQKKDLALLLASLFQWRQAWLKNDLNTYLSFYDHKAFKHSNGRNFQQFQDFKRRVFSYGDSKNIIFKNITIVPYPNHENKSLYRIGFREIYNSRRSHFNGNKVLIVTLKDNHMNIITEK